MIKEKLKKPFKHLRSFIKDESGAELLEIAVGILIAVILIATVAGIVNMLNTGLEGSEQSIIDEFGKVGIELEKPE